ncbi:MAG: CoA transferase, partial [Acidobacteria bacterium]|nr:CoA transferase [Acidobacteriota bacterium]
MSKPALDGLRVLDLCDLRGAMAARILADLGAEVLRFPLDDGTPLTRGGTATQYRNLNKSTLGEGADLSSLLDGADVVIDNRPETREVCGLADVDAMRSDKPELVQVCIRDFGMTGPRSHWTLDPLPALASSGALFATGFPDRSPCWLPVHLAHDCASVHGALGAVAAVTNRRRHGDGDVIEVSVQEAAIAGLVPWSVCVDDYLHINPLLP